MKYLLCDCKGDTISSEEYVNKTPFTEGLPFIAAREQGYALEIIDFWDCPDRPIKRELNNLEEYGVLTSKVYGKTIVYSINPRYFLRKELTALLLKMIEAYPPEWKEKLFYNRRRPRAKGKPAKYLTDLQKGDKK